MGRRARRRKPRLRAALRKAGQREVGGILMAKQLRPGHFRIVDFSLDAFSGSHTRFRRDPKTHQKVLDAFFQRRAAITSGSTTSANGTRIRRSRFNPASRISRL
jgi:hypothetical protein